MSVMKIVTWLLLLVSINATFRPKLPLFQISLPQSSPLSSLLSLFYPPPSPSDECEPDLSWFQDVNASDFPVAFETCVQQVSELPQKIHPDTDKGTDEIIQSYGYPLEVHKVTTEDGYILTVHRIPKPGKLPIYLQHGLGGCSDNWLFQYRNRSLAFLLADYDYDVWLANSRGTSYSLEHLTLQWDNPVNYSYWDFSWHEIGKYDVPAITDHIISATGYSKIVYIGHSMGTTTYLVGLDQVPELNNKILAGILLAPTGFLSRSPSPLRVIAELVGPNPYYLEPILKGRLDFRHNDQLVQSLNLPTFADICTPTAIRCTACDEIMFALFGMDAPQMNYTNIPNIVSKFPNIMSAKMASHYAQSILYCSFRQFDYGVEKNWLVYNNSTPPDYTLKNITVPTYSFYGEFDNLCRPKDVQRTLDLLPRQTLKENIKVNFTLFNHSDFILAEDAISNKLYATWNLSLDHPIYDMDSINFYRFSH